MDSVCLPSPLSVGGVMGVILLPTQNTHFLDVPDLMRETERQCLSCISMREDMF